MTRTAITNVISTTALLPSPPGGRCMATEPETGASPLRRRGSKTATLESPPDDATPAIEPSPPRRRLNRRYLAILIVGALGAGVVVGLAAAFATRHTTPTF